MASADFQYIDSDSQLQIFCEESAGAKLVGFDTEFVSESRYRPDLCLLQVVAGSVKIDSLERVIQAGASLVGVRGAVCAGDRSGQLCEQKLREFCQRMVEVNL